MSNPITKFLNKQPLLYSYMKQGLVNLNALARLIKTSEPDLAASTVPAVSMELRRLLSKPFKNSHPIEFPKYNLQIITRSELFETIIEKNTHNQEKSRNIINELMKTKIFVSLVEGEKEIVIITDTPLNQLTKNFEEFSGALITTENLSLISINFPIELRKYPGIYSILMQTLAEENISIQSFHTIGGEINILVEEKDLLKTQQTLHNLLKN